MTEQQSKGPVHQVADTEIEVISNLGSAPVIYADGMQGILAANGTVRVALYQVLAEAAKTGTEAPIRKVVVARLIFPQSTLASIAAWLTEHAKRLSELPPDKSPDAPA